MVRVFGGRAVNSAYSTDGGSTWTPFRRAPRHSMYGKIAVSPDAKTIVWTAASGPWSGPSRVAHVTHDRGESWQACRGLKPGWHVISDRVNPQHFYAFSPRQGHIYMSADAENSFHRMNHQFPRGSASLRSVPGQAGDLWLASSHGLYHCRALGAEVSRISAIDSATRIGFGRAAPGLSYPAIFIVGTMNGVYGIYRSDDTGATWTRINDYQHQFFTIDAITGDPRIYGRVYLGTSGRGIIYGDRA